MKKNKGMIIVFMTPAVVMFVLVFLYPIIRTILMSFFKIEGITDPMSKWTFSGIDNYVKLANTTLFRISMWNLARIWFIGGIIVMSLALLFAVIITSGIRFKSFFRAMIYLPNIVSAVALATMWLQYVYSPKYGLIKNFFQALGLDSLARIQWLDNDHKFMALLLAYCFGMVGYHMLIFASGIERISDDYFEAATLDGANKFNQFRYITLTPVKRSVQNQCHHVERYQRWIFRMVPAVLHGHGRYPDHYPHGLSVHADIWGGQQRHGAQFRDWSSGRRDAERMRGHCVLALQSSASGQRSGILGKGENICRDYFRKKKNCTGNRCAGRRN